MITSLSGRVVGQGDDHAVLEVQGVGYLVTASARSLRRLPRAGEAATVLVDLQITDETIRLYGFIDEAERSAFRLLQTVQGVGARVALSLLGVLGPDGLAAAVAAGDKAALSRAQGVGARLAARILTELKDRLGQLAASGASAPASVSGVSGEPGEDAVVALAQLGFSRIEAVQALARARASEGDDAGLDRLIRAALVELAPRDRSR